MVQPSSFRWTPEEHLAEAKRHLAAAELNLARQPGTVARLARVQDHQGEASASALLTTMERSLATMRTHWDMILREIAGRSSLPHPEPGNPPSLP